MGISSLRRHHEARAAQLANEPKRPPLTVSYEEAQQMARRAVADAGGGDRHAAHVNKRLDEALQEAVERINELERALEGGAEAFDAATAALAEKDARVAELESHLLASYAARDELTAELVAAKALIDEATAPAEAVAADVPEALPAAAADVAPSPTEEPAADAEKPRGRNGRR